MEKFSFKDIKANFILSVMVFFVMTIVQWVLGQEVICNKGMLHNFLYVMLYTYSLSLINKLIFIYLDKIFEKDRFSPIRLLVGFSSSFIASLFTIVLLRIFQFVIIEGNSFESFKIHEHPANYIFAIVVTSFILVSFYAFNFYKGYHEAKLHQQQIIAGTASAQFESLKSQIDPHFLFNSLNVLSSLIEENPEQAQRFTTSLSKIYRYVLEQKDKEMVSVEEELSFAKTYMNLLKMRFENSLSYELQSQNCFLPAKVIPLSLQLLLENTVKHNIVSEQKPLQIRIYFEKEYLVIQNNLQKKNALSDRKGVGLQNIINRYKILTTKEVHVEESTQFFTVKIPLL